MITIITKDESNLFLSNYPDWLVLYDGVKDEHIKKASAYTQSRWSMVDVGWDEVVIGEGVKEAASHYAYASFSGNLFGNVGTADAKSIRRKYKKMGPMVDDVEYFSSSGSTDFTTAFGYPDTLMRLEGFSDGSNDSLTRV